MENFPTAGNNNENKTGESPFEHSKKFFSSDNIRDILGGVLISAGAMYALIGIFENLTGDMLGNVIEQYKDRLPSLLNKIVAYLDTVPTQMKTGGGSSMMFTGEALRNFRDFRNLFASKEVQDK